MASKGCAVVIDMFERGSMEVISLKTTCTWISDDTNMSLRKLIGK